MTHFWHDMPHSAKWDVLQESRHMHLIESALGDCETGLEPVDRHNYMLYGKEEALLVDSPSFILRVGLDLYRAFLCVINKN